MDFVYFKEIELAGTLEYARYGDLYVACFESEFGFWGAATEDRGSWDGDAVVARTSNALMGTSPTRSNRSSPGLPTRDHLRLRNHRAPARR